jgi:hypothetical protein
LDDNEDNIFADHNKAMLLFDAVKKIGNPEAIGTHYPFTWNDIVQVWLGELII